MAKQGKEGFHKIVVKFSQQAKMMLRNDSSVHKVSEAVFSSGAALSKRYRTNLSIRALPNSLLMVCFALMFRLRWVKTTIRTSAHGKSSRKSLHHCLAFRAVALCLKDLGEPYIPTRRRCSSPARAH